MNLLPFGTTIMPMEPISTFYDDLGTKAYKRIKEMIVSGELKPGQKLLQEEMANLLGVSRTPLLQAIGKLERENLVLTIPRRGSHVRHFSEQEFLDVFDIRGQLEPMGAYQAAKHIDDDGLELLANLIECQRRAASHNKAHELHEADKEFHLAIMRSSGNHFLHDILRAYANALCDSERLLKSPQQRIDEHENILSALREHDPLSARELMYYHINGGARAKLESLLGKKGKQVDDTED